MTGRKRPIITLKAFAPACSVFLLSIGIVQAEDLSQATPTAPFTLPELPSGWFVKLGGLAAINQSSTRLYAQTIVGPFGVGPQLLIPGRGESLSNLFTLSFQSGYFVTPNWSVETAGGFPVWQTVRITGFSATPPFAGTILVKQAPAVAPITIVYHVRQLAAFQPYAGVGIAPFFVFKERDSFATGNSTEPSLALVLQGGVDYMFSPNWGVFFDAKKYFDRSIGKATGLNFGPPTGAVHLAATAVTNSQPWVLSTGLTYRF